MDNQNKEQLLMCAIGQYKVAKNTPLVVCTAVLIALGGAMLTGMGLYCMSKGGNLALGQGWSMTTKGGDSAVMFSCEM